MSRTINIQAGQFKGRSIPIPPDIKGHAHFTPAIFKKTLFSMIDALDLDGSIKKDSTVFIDLFAGSGQMGYEALSRGCGNIVLCELAKERFSVLYEFASKLKKGIVLLNKDAFRCFDKIADLENYETIIYYIDPPYTFWKVHSEKIKIMVDKIFTLYPQKQVIVAIQSPDRFEWEGFDLRNAGNAWLHFRRRGVSF